MSNYLSRSIAVRIDDVRESIMFVMSNEEKLRSAHPTLKTHAELDARSKIAIKGLTVIKLEWKNDIAHNGERLWVTYGKLVL